MPGVGSVKKKTTTLNTKYRMLASILGGMSAGVDIADGGFRRRKYAVNARYGDLLRIGADMRRAAERVKRLSAKVS